MHIFVGLFVICALIGRELPLSWMHLRLHWETFAIQNRIFYMMIKTLKLCNGCSRPTTKQFEFYTLHFWIIAISQHGQKRTIECWSTKGICIWVSVWECCTLSCRPDRNENCGLEHTVAHTHMHNSGIVVNMPNSRSHLSLVYIDYLAIIHILNWCICMKKPISSTIRNSNSLHSNCF